MTRREKPTCQKCGRTFTLGQSVTLVKRPDGSVMGSYHDRVGPKPSGPTCADLAEGRLVQIYGDY